jgi:cytidylate kinase
MESERDITTRISERQMRLWNALHSTGRSKNISHRFITISPDEGTLGNEVAQTLARDLGWQVYDKEIVNEIASNSHVREELVRRLDEKSQRLAHQIILEGILDMFRTPGSHFGSEDYHESLLKTLATLAAHGDAVLVGRGANFALRWSEHVIHVRIVGSFEVRVQRFIERYKLNPEIARQRLEAIDAEKRAFIRHHYHQDYDDVRFYHAVFNTDHLSVERVVGSIMPLLHLENSNPALETDLKILNG